MLGLTPLGAVHTAISLLALAAGIFAFVRDREIAPDSTVGKVYLWSTVLTCLTGFGIFEQGGFGKPHALGVLTLLVLLIATLVHRNQWFGAAQRYVVTVSYSLTFFFHMIPGVTETFTRVPTGSPMFSSPEDPNLEKVVGVIFLVFLVGVAFQVKRLRSEARMPSRRLVPPYA